MWYILLNISHSHRICIKLEETRPRFMLTSLQETQMKEWSLRVRPRVNELYQQMEAGFSHDNRFQTLSNWESCSSFHTWSSLTLGCRQVTWKSRTRTPTLSFWAWGLESHTCFLIQAVLRNLNSLYNNSCQPPLLYSSSTTTDVPYFSIYVLFAQICVSRWTGFIHSEFYNS